jgi:hypothetical protein
LRALYEAGIRVPEDMAVVGFDGILLGQFTTPALTTMYQPLKRSIERSLRLLGVDRLQIVHLHDPENSTFEEIMARGRVDFPLNIDDNPLAAMVASGALTPGPLTTESS